MSLGGDRGAAPGAFQGWIPSGQGAAILLSIAETGRDREAALGVAEIEGGPIADALGPRL